MSRFGAVTCEACKERIPRSIEMLKSPFYLMTEVGTVSDKPNAAVHVQFPPHTGAACGCPTVSRFNKQFYGLEGAVGVVRSMLYFEYFAKNLLFLFVLFRGMMTAK